MKHSRFGLLLFPLTMVALASACQRGAEDAGARASQVKTGMSAYEAGNRDKAREAWTKASKAGDRDAQYFMGVLENEAEKPDYPAAFEWFKKASAQGHVKATYNLALAYERGQGVKRDRAKALELLQQASKAGDTDSGYMLGLLLLDDGGGPGTIGHARALQALTNAAEHGNARAQYLLGTGYADGSLGSTNILLARRWLGKAIASGMIEALRPYVALQQSGDLSGIASTAELAKNATAGDASAQHAYAVRLLTGQQVKADPASGLAWLRKSADLGYPDAQYDLGIQLSRSDDPDYAQALQWLQRAAASGHARAQYAIGQMKAEGLGVEKNEREAVRWYRQAADSGLATAEYAMGYATSEGAGIQKDDPDAMDWFRKAAQHGHAEAAFRISTMYANEEGVGKDGREQRRWECRAAVLGSDRAMARIGRSGGMDSACEAFGEDLATFAVEVLGKSGAAPVPTQAN